MNDTFPCPKCGQPLTPPPHAVSMQCPACRNFIIIPDSAINHSGESREPASATEQPYQREAIVERLRAGDKIGAIKLYRQMTGAGLKDAKDAVDYMETNRSSANVVVMPPVEQPSAPAAGQPGSQEAMRNLILSTLAGGDKIEAIKRYRELTGADLKTAKDAVDLLEKVGGVGNYPNSPAFKRIALLLSVGMAVFMLILIALILFLR